MRSEFVISGVKYFKPSGEVTHTNIIDGKNKFATPGFVNVYTLYPNPESKLRADSSLDVKILLRRITDEYFFELSLSGSTYSWCIFFNLTARLFKRDESRQ